MASTHVCAHSNVGTPESPDFPRIHRYLSLGMYGEAAAALNSAVKADEFNGELRFLYGSALQGIKKYDDAILNLRLSIRLDNSRWEESYLHPSPLFVWVASLTISQRFPTAWRTGPFQPPNAFPAPS